MFDKLLKDIKMKFGIKTGVFDGLFDASAPVEDISGGYHISGVGSFNLKFLDVTFLKDGIAYFRPFIRGFIVLLIALYNIKQAVGFLGYDAGVTAGNPDSKELRVQK